MKQNKNNHHNNNLLRAEGRPGVLAELPYHALSLHAWLGSQSPDRVEGRHLAARLVRRLVPCPYREREKKKEKEKKERKKRKKTK